MFELFQKFLAKHVIANSTWFIEVLFSDFFALSACNVSVCVCVWSASAPAEEVPDFTPLPWFQTTRKLIGFVFVANENTRTFNSSQWGCFRRCKSCKSMRAKYQLSSELCLRLQSRNNINKKIILLIRSCFSFYVFFCV
jgi:hypothetical protein